MPQAIRGHWPAGKRRHRELLHWQATRKAVIQHAIKRRKQGERSIRLLASELGVSPRTVARWLAGEDLPPTRAQSALRRWAQKQ